MGIVRPRLGAPERVKRLSLCSYASPGVEPRAFQADEKADDGENETDWR